MAGNEISTIELSSIAMNMPSVVFERAVHLYRSGSGGRVVTDGWVLVVMGHRLACLLAWSDEKFTLT